MSKVVVIEYCGDCPNRVYEGNDMFCDLTSRETYENSPIPDWCPLPDKEGE